MRTMSKFGGWLTPPDVSTAVEGIKWGQDKVKDWHILPYFNLHTMKYYECTTFFGDIYIVDSVDFPPDKGVLCVACRGHYTSRIVEAE
jgi:hypothetical protein